MMKNPNVVAISLFCFLVFIGCADDNPGAKSSTPADSGGHHHEAPHGGTLVELGDHVASIEFLFESESGTLTAYVLDAHAENPVRLTAGSLVVEIELDGNNEYIPLELKGVANSLTGETEGDTSQYSVTDAALKGRSSFGITIPAIEVRGTTFEEVSARIS